MNLYTLTSELHDEQAVSAVTKEFLDSLHILYNYKGSDYADYGCSDLDVIYVRTGGTEGIFKQLLPQLLTRSRQPFYLLTSGKSNSLAASAEILSFLRQHNLKGEIIHGSANYIHQRILLLEQATKAKQQLRNCRLGVIGKPSDWLISSYADYGKVKETLGIDLVDISIDELLNVINHITACPPTETSDRPQINEALPGANRIYLALKEMIAQHQLQGFTLRCFDLLTALHNTGCLALAKLNAEGYVAGCEGDVPTMLTMMIVRAATGVSGFQANPASIDPETGEMVFAHCTIPLNMVEHYELDTHFESGIGVGIRGYMKEGPVTIFKVSGDLSRHFIAEGELIRNESKSDLCRTQQVIRLLPTAAQPQPLQYFLTNPIGNHHVIMPGHQQALLEEILK